MLIHRKEISLDEICKLILRTDNAINYVAIIDERLGRVLETRTRNSVYLNLPHDMKEVFFMEFALRQRMRSEFDEYFGPVRFTHAEREKESFLSFPLDGDVIIISYKPGIDSRSLAKKILGVLQARKSLNSIDFGDHLLKIYNGEI